MKKYFLIFFIFLSKISFSQELYVSTEPASNMASGSIGIRLNSKFFRANSNDKFEKFRIEPEVMFGVNKRLMLHIAAYASDMFQQNIKVEGASLYGKYRLFSQDDVHEHFRLAAFAKVAVINNPEHLEQPYSQSNDIDIDGNNSGIAAGIIATKLKNKLALSASLGYARRLNNTDHTIEVFQPLNAITYTTSAGLLLFPKEYTSYRQTNINLYIEMLGQSFLDKRQYYFDVAPAIQFIFNSISRVDISYRTQFSGNINRIGKTYFMLRLEYNLLNVFSKK